MLRPSLVLALLIVASSPVAAQDPVGEVLAFDVVISDPVVDVDIGGSGTVEILVRDLSRDSTGGLAGVPSGAALSHEITFSLTPLEPDAGWTVAPPSTLYTRGGEEVRTTASFLVVGATKVETYIANLTAKFRPTQFGEPQFFYATIGAKTTGLTTFVATPLDTPQIKPREATNIRVQIQNLGLYETTYVMEVVDNPCDLTVVVPTQSYVDLKSTGIYNVELKAPWKEKLWYLSENCGIQLRIYPTGAESFAQVVVLTVQIDGQSIFHIEKLFPVFVLLLLLLLLLLFILRRKARVEEEILGKPQKPWTIPIEVLYLKALRRKDERAWYIVRHHLMEEEYRSSLLWYHAYKKATKGARKKETLVLRQEKTYERWKRAWLKAIARPLKDADRFEAKLQRKLDRKAAQAERKMARKVRRITRRMAAAHGKQVERALEKWQKQVKKADKKGLAAPPRPTIPEPDYPEEPEVEPTPLAQHKWSKRAARFRARMTRKQGDLEVKFEKADARKLAKLRRKVQRVARRLDDPTFVAEHPLLKSDA